MCDLIDLNSPNKESTFHPKLASPLIPVPFDTANNEKSPLVIGKRDSLENNPFDKVLHETTEYIQKKDDPFEVVLEKALKKDDEKNVKLRTNSYNFADDYTPKRRKRAQMSKRNRTLDESMIIGDLCTGSGQQKILSPLSNEIIITDLDNANLLDNSMLAMRSLKTPVISLQSADSSILNVLEMSDTLHNSHTADEDNVKCVSLPKAATPNENVSEEQVATFKTYLKTPKHRRSFSQGAKTSPRKMCFLNNITQSAKHSQRKESVGSVSSLNSFNSTDLLNEAFVNSQISGSSTLSNLSNISAVTTLNSNYSSTFSSLTSNGTLNRTFLNNTSDKLDDTGLETRISESSTNSGAKKLEKMRFSMSDFVDRFNILKAASSQLDTPDDSDKRKEVVVEPEKKNNEQNTNSKLIDIEVFTPEANRSKEQRKSSTSDTSSDSVFTDGSEITKSIFHEAKALAKTFEELAGNTTSGSASTDDFFASSPTWISDLLPAFDDEVDNLIELPTSPNASGGDCNLKNEPASCRVPSVDKTENRTDTNNKIEENIKDLESELVDPVLVEKRVAATTLLLDLKKLINSDNNTEAGKVLENLEKALGIEYKNNTELLATCLNMTNDSTKSPEKLSNGSNDDESKNENLAADLAENLKGSVSRDDFALNDAANKGESVDCNEKRPMKIEETVTSADNPTENGDPRDVDFKIPTKNLSNEELTMQLVTNFAQLLSGQVAERSILELLTNFGTVLNITSNKCNANNKVEADSTSAEIQQTPKNSKLKRESKLRSTVLSRSSNALSFDLELNKKASEDFTRRSFSISHTPPAKVTPSLSKTRKSSQFTEVKKRFPSDPGFINLRAGKKVTSVELDVKVSSTGNNGQNEKITGAVKNKLKKKTERNLVSKKGPLKAVLPIGSMQRTESFGSKVFPSADTITPPKYHKIFSSTPNSPKNELTGKKSRSKPVASSTPDVHLPKVCKVPIQTDTSMKRHISCDISPVPPASVDNANNNETKESPKKLNKIPTPKKSTPKRRPSDSGIPRSQTPPVMKRMNSSISGNRYDRTPLSPQCSMNKSNSRKNSPLKKSAERIQLSPLRDSNKINPKVKPLNLISKLRRHSVTGNVMEKENNYI